MLIKIVTTDELRKMKDVEGIVFQGCGGDLGEWVTGVNEMLTKAGILIDGSEFTKVFNFQNEEVSNLLFPFEEGLKIEIEKLAMWRLQTYSTFAGMWLSDYVDNRLGGFVTEKAEKQKPDCALIGEDGNIFNLIGVATRTLRNNGMPDEAVEMRKRIMEGAKNYYEALNIIGEYVNITDGSSDDFDECEGISMQ